ncbi:MAG: hypothetical protein Q8P31_05775 [Bacillota bacterium]|nr:hypothetical protein [Bacillota bacterium]
MSKRHNKCREICFRVNDLLLIIVALVLLCGGNLNLGNLNLGKLTGLGDVDPGQLLGSLLGTKS